MSIQAFQRPVFTPALRIVTAITNGNPAAVTTSFPHGYASGLVVRLLVPLGFGMQQANKLFGEIDVTSPTTYNISIDTSLFDPFVVPAGNLQYAQCNAYGEANYTVYHALQNQLPF